MVIVTELVYTFFTCFLNSFTLHGNFTDSLYIVINFDNEVQTCVAHVQSSYFSFNLQNLIPWKAQKSLCHIAVPFFHLSWRKHAVAHVESLIVVEVYDTGNDASCIIEVLGSFHVVEPLLLYYSIHSFGDCILCRVVVFSHAYARVYTFQSCQIVHSAVQLINEGCCLKGSLLLGTSFF